MLDGMQDEITKTEQILNREGKIDEDEFNNRIFCLKNSECVSGYCDYWF